MSTERVRDPAGAERVDPLPELLTALRRHWVAALLVSLPFVAGIVGYAESLPAQYDGTAVASFTPRPTTNIGGDTIRVIVPRYREYVTSRETTDRVAAGLPVSAGELADRTTARVDTDTANLVITVRLESARTAAAAANDLAQAAVAFSASDDLLQGQVVSRAVPSGTPSAPRRRLLEALGLVVGVGAGLVAAVVAERRRPRIRSTREVEAVAGYDVVGRVPASRALLRQPARALSDPAIGTAVRSLRLVLDYASRERPVRVLAVTSSEPGEGKSTVAAALASSLTGLDVRVLLVDGDLHKPSVASLFRVDHAPGFRELLDGPAELTSVIRDGPRPGLSLLPTGPADHLSDQLTRHFRAFADSALATHDIVVVDCPPILASDDSRTIASQADAVLMVVAMGTATSQLSESVAVLETLGVRMLGLVANKVPGRVPTYGPVGAER